MVFIGIDPGVKGCTAVIWPSYSIELRRHDKYELSEIADYLAEVATESRCVIESVRSSPQMGVRSAFTFGQSFGGAVGMLTALRIPFQEVRPQRWLRSLSIRTRQAEETATNWKKHLATVAKQLFPQVTGINQQTADSLLIAEFARRFYCGGECG